MTITSFYFFVFLVGGGILYYVLPKSWQWLELLIMSLMFYYCTAKPYTIIYLVISAAVAYVSTLWMESAKKKNSAKPKVITATAVLAIAINVFLWLVLKGRDLWAFPGYIVLKYVHIPQLDYLLSIKLIASLGMGYYTLQVLGYILDCYWGTVTPQRNPLKLFLFVGYFPQLTTGPISTYSQLETLYTKHYFSYDNVTRGAQRILWGLVKKLVLAERIGIIVSGITENLDQYSGFYAWIAILMYPIQMYADFSGCMDIVLGASEIFDIHLSENFNNPFFSRTSQEFWLRWHITLGAWAKTYVLYPLLKSKPMVKFSKFCRKKFNKQLGKFIATAAGMFVLWMTMGIWHGGVRYIVGVSLWYWVILMAGEWMEPEFQKINTALHIKTESFSWHLFQSARTYLIYAIGAVFFSMGFSRGILLLRQALGVFKESGANPWIFFDGSVLELGIRHVDINIILVVVGLIIIVGILREKYGYARNWIAKQGFAFRWFIWLFLFLLVLIYGNYGPGYDATEFIYQGF